MSWEKRFRTILALTVIPNGREESCPVHAVSFENLRRSLTSVRDDTLGEVRAYWFGRVLAIHAIGFNKAMLGEEGSTC
jgi:hypothetical protein